MKENENEKRDTIENVLAEYRNDADAMDRGWLYQPTTEYLRRLLDRIEAAWKREREELDKRISDLEAYAKLWTGRADELRLKCDEFYAKAKPVGNAAAMREALEFCLRIIGENGIRGNVFLGDIQEAHRAMTAALSAPARNCDIYKNKKDAEAAFISEECKHPCGNCTVNDEYGCALVHECGVDWLFATAEREGEGDGR